MTLREIFNKIDNAITSGINKIGEGIENAWNVILDTDISNIFGYIVFLIFSVVVLMYIITGWEKAKEFGKNPHKKYHSNLNKKLVYIQYALYLLIGFVVLQMFLANVYFNNILLIINLFLLIVCGVILAIFAPSDNK